MASTYDLEKYRKPYLKMVEEMQVSGDAAPSFKEWAEQQTKQDQATSPKKGNMLAKLFGG